MHDIKCSFISHIQLVMNELFVFKRKLFSFIRLPLESIEHKHTFCASSHEMSLSLISISKLIHSLSLLLSNFNVSPQKSTSTTNHCIHIYLFILVSQTQLSLRYRSQTSVSFSLSLSLSVCMNIYTNLNTQSSD